MAAATWVFTWMSWLCMSIKYCLIIFSGSSALSSMSLMLARTSWVTRSRRVIESLLDIAICYIEPSTIRQPVKSHTRPIMANRLINETSPYLLQHAHNPVDWYPWGEDALARAKQEDKPILLSIGYSACHWCHVMEHESFENEEIARIMNEHFVSIKVDREERPDLDSIYMSAVQAMTQRGGWPMTVFLTPAGAPFYCGTYFPPEDRMGMPGFPRVLIGVAKAYADRRDEV